jgi:hypothetical protein
MLYTTLLEMFSDKTTIHKIDTWSQLVPPPVQMWAEVLSP